MDWKKLRKPTRVTLTNTDFQHFCYLGKSLKYSLTPTIENQNFESKDELKNAMSQFAIFHS